MEITIDFIDEDEFNDPVEVGAEFVNDIEFEEPGEFHAEGFVDGPKFSEPFELPDEPNLG